MALTWADAGAGARKPSSRGRKILHWVSRVGLDPANMRGHAWWLTHPLVSEFRPLLRRLALPEARATFLAALTLWLALVAGVLSAASLSGAHVLKLTVEGSVRETPHSAAAATFAVKQLAGYFAEPNHGLYYLIIVPGCFLLAGWSLGRCHRVLQRLAQKKILVPGADGRPFLRFQRDLGRLNSAIFLWLLPVVFASMVAWNAIREMRTWSDPDVLAGTHEAFGYMQAPFFPRLLGHFHGLPDGAVSPSGTWERLRHMPKLRQACEVEVQERLGRHADVFQAWRTAQLISIPNAPGDFDVQPREALSWSTTTVDIPAALSQRYLTLRVIPAGGTVTPSQNRWFLVFFLGVVLIESTFHTFAIWIACKYVFWLALVRLLLPPKGLFGWRLALHFEDPQKEYGLRELHHTYNLILYAVLIGAFSVLVQSENSLRTSTQEVFDRSSVVTALIQFGVGFVVLPLAVIAAFWNRLTLRRQATEAKLAITRQLEASTDPAEQSKLRDRCDLIEAQCPWPQENREFWRIVIAATVVLIIPLAGESLEKVPFLPSIAEFTSVVDLWQDFVKNLAERTPPAPTEFTKPLQETVCPLIRP